MRTEQSQVRAFHTKVGQLVRKRPTVPDDAVRHARADLVREEYEEFDEALRHGDLVDIAQEGVDVIYIVLGAFVECGLDIQPFWDAIHKANMKKVKGRTAKAVKPKGWRAPDLGALLEEQQ